MSTINHIFEPQEASRKPPRVGDVFVMKISGGFIRGRVVSTSARSDLFSDADRVLIYVYSGASVDGSIPAVHEMSPPKLLIAPAMTNAMGWRKGYFKTIGRIDLTEDQKLPRHVFRNLSSGEFYNEFAEPVEAPVQLNLVGDQALESHVTVEDAISRALGMGSIIVYS